ncbi:MAG: cbb3-type cytochrome c oxidase N-terminal domain-containing protein [Saprospiraceae bacterium]
MKNKIWRIAGLATAFGLMALGATAQETAAAPASSPNFYESLFSNITLVAAAVVILGALATLVHLLNVMVKVQQVRIYQEQGLEPYLEEVKKGETESLWTRLYKRWTNVVPVEREEEIVLHHNYDGIRELDNSLPPWWVALFVITIVFSGVYMVYYHWGGSGPSSAEEYTMEVEKAQVAVEAYLAKQANNVDETNVTALNDEQSISLGKTIYDSKCVACHGAAGEGGVGPNLTDDYWLHGGSVQDIFKTIKYGVPEKGMIPWSDQIRPADMQRVASFILSLHGTNPPNGKEPQGEKFQASPTPSDSTAAQQAQTIGMN